MLPPAPGTVAVEEARFVLRHEPTPATPGGSAQRLQLADVERDISEVRAWFREHGRDRFLWVVGPSARPDGLAETLSAAGAFPWPDDPVWAGMVLVGEPPRVDGVEVRRVDSADLAHAAIDVNAAAGVVPEDAVAAMHDAVGRSPRSGAAPVSTFVAFVDGTPAGTGTSWYGTDGVYLAGGATRPEFRGRGVYRALIHARWEDATRRGKEGLVAQAGHMSRGILARLGFEEVCEVRAFEDASAL